MEGRELVTSASRRAIDPDAVDVARAAVPPDALLGLVVDMFSALADPTRARIVYALSAGPLCVRDLALVAGVSESAVSHQLRLLRDRRLVKPRREGTVIYYTVDDHHLPALFKEAEYHADHVRQGVPDHPYPHPVSPAPDSPLTGKRRTSCPGEGKRKETSK